MRTEPRRVSSLGELIDNELQQSKRSHPVEVKPHAEINLDVATGILTRALIPAMRADQQVLQRATAVNELARREQAARANEAALSAPPVDIDLYD